MGNGKKDKKGIVAKVKAWSWKRKILILIAIGLIVVMVKGFVFPGSSTSEDIPVSIGKVERMDLRQEVKIRSVIRGTDSAQVFSAANYRISEILVKEGDKVELGQVLARLDATALRSQYNQAAIALGEARRAYEAQAALYKEGAISKDDYLKTKAAYDTAALALSSYNMEENANVTSPIAGTVTRVNASVGKIAGAGTGVEPLFVVENLEKLQMKGQVSEYDYSKIQIGQIAEISAEVLGDDTVKGVVSAIAPTGEAKGAGSSEMVIPITIDVDKGDSKLIAGVTARATIITAFAEDAVTVPTDAIFQDPVSRENFVFVVGEDLVVKKTPVEVLVSGNFNIQVEGNINIDDRVVLSPPIDLEDGAKVTEK